jgi:hypothetical protein
MAPEPGHPSIAELANQIRTCYRSDHTQAETRIENLLETRFEGFLPAEKLALIEELRRVFETPPARSPGSADTVALSDFFSLLLGQRIASTDLGSEDLTQHLASSLNSIFDQLNELVGIIHATFGEETSALETIRHLIGSDLDRKEASGSLSSYIGQIKDAFLIANQAAKLAASIEVGKILAELDPERLAGDAEKGLRFGFMRRGELVEAYREKYRQIKKWFEAEHFIEDYAREFERACQRLHSEKGRTT